MEKKYLSASFITTASSILVKAIAFLQVAVLTRLTTTEEYGEFSVFLSYVNIVTLVIGGSVASSFGIAKRDFGKKYEAYISSMLGLSYLFLAIAVLVCFLIFGTNWKALAFFVIIHSFSLNILTNYDIKQSFDFKYLKGAIVSLLTAISCFVTVVIAVRYTSDGNKGAASIIATTVTTLLMAIICQLIMWHPGKILYNKEFWKYAVTNSFLMIPHNLSLVILNQMDRIMIGDLLNNSFVAIYSAIYSLSIVISIMWSSIKKVWVTWVYDKLNTGSFLFIRRINTLLLIVMVLGVIDYCFITPEIIIIFLPNEYWDGMSIMAPILFGYFFSFLFSIYVNIEYFYKKTKLIAIGTIIAAAVNIVTNYFLIPIHGYKVSAYTTLLSYFVLFIYHYYYNMKKEYFNYKSMWLLICFLFFILTLFQYTIENMWLRYALLVVMNFIPGIGLMIMARYKKSTIKQLFVDYLSH